MKREILFRGKVTKVPKYMQDKNRMSVGDWVYGSYVSYPVAQIFDLEDEYIVDPATVGQFTGLCDKNGFTKIFEGDKVETPCGEIGIIEYLEEDGMFIISFPITSGHSSWIATFGDFEGNEMAVIGNIHDTPELAKEEAE